MESCLYLSRGDYEDYRVFAQTVMRYGGEGMDFSMSQIIATLTETKNAEKT